MADSERSSHEIGVALIEAVTKLFWPVAVVLIILMFQHPIYEVMSMISKQIPIGGASVELAGFKVSLPKGWEFPKPSTDVAETLPKLDKKLLEFVLRYPPDTSYPLCIKGKPKEDLKFADFEQMSDSLYTRLEKLGLVSLKKMAPQPSGLENNTCFDAHFEESYAETRQYLINILSSVDFRKLS
jgi:hypothetical protein